MTYEDFLKEEINTLPRPFKIAIENGTKGGGPGIIKYLIERIAFVRWERYTKSEEYMLEIFQERTKD